MMAWTGLGPEDGVLLARVEIYLELAQHNVSVASVFVGNDFVQQPSLVQIQLRQLLRAQPSNLRSIRNSSSQETLH